VAVNFTECLPILPEDGLVLGHSYSASAFILAANTIECQQLTVIFTRDSPKDGHLSNGSHAQLKYDSVPSN